MTLPPGWMRINFARLAGTAAFVQRRLPGVRRTMSRWLAWQLRLVHATLLKEQGTPVKLCAVADRGRTTERSAALRFADGQQAAADGVAAAVTAWGRRQAHPAGLCGLSEITCLEELRAGLVSPPALVRHGDGRLPSAR
jgi:hypothetical protein